MDRVVCGIDEAGRGALAGPLVVSGVVLFENIEGLADSKKLTKKKREDLFVKIVKSSKYKIVFISNEFIDKHGIGVAIRESLKKIRKVFMGFDIIFDGNTNFGVDGIRHLIKADTKIAEVSAASILSKVARDRYMVCLKEFCEYGFDKHKGYGTKLHYELIRKYGVSKIHRKSFRLIKNNTTRSLFD